MTDETEYVTIRLPKSDWNQIVGDMENMCGCGAEEIEILQGVEILAESKSGTDEHGVATYEKNASNQSGGSFGGSTVPLPEGVWSKANPSINEFTS